MAAGASKFKEGEDMSGLFLEETEPRIDAVTPAVRLLAAVLLLVPGAGAGAAELPQRDPTEECRAQAAYDAATYSFDEAGEAKRCLSVAQDFYDAVRDAWAEVPEPVQTACIERIDAEHTIGTLFYWSLYQCVDPSRASASPAPVSFRF
jgi:hypothetical protein